jgi:hypothetical protein
MLTYCIACLLWFLALGNLLAGNPLKATFCGCTALGLWAADLTDEDEDDKEEGSHE